MHGAGHAWSGGSDSGTFQVLADIKSELTAGIYMYSRQGFGKYAGLQSRGATGSRRLSVTSGLRFC